MKRALLEPFQECKQASFRERMILAIHQPRDFRLVNFQQLGNVALFEYPSLQEQADGMPQLRASQKLISIVQPKVSKHVAAADFIVRTFGSLHSCSSIATAWR